MQEQIALLTLLDQAEAAVEAEFEPDGYNIGINDGAGAGQTVPHLHIHLILRFKGAGLILEVASAGSQEVEAT